MRHIEVVSQLEREHLRQLSPLLDAAARADGHEPLGEHKFLRLRRGGDLSSAVLAFDGDHLQGYGHVVTFADGDDRRASCEFVVHPDARRGGIGRLLLGHAVRHASSLDASRLDVWAYNDTAASARIAAHYGFTATRRLLHLHRHVVDAIDVPLPSGATVRPFVAGRDEDAWLALNRSIFAAHPEQGAWTRADLDARMAQPWFDAGDLLVLEFASTPAGFCWLKVEDRGDDGRVGEIYVVGVEPSVRGRGVGRALLAAGLAHLQRRQADIAAIYVDETNTAARALYEATGFHHHHVDVCYSRDLRADSALDDAAA